MAVMIPPTVPADLSSSAERRIFKLLEHGLNNDWTVLHSLGITGHAKKSWAEIDFVLIGPLGVLCLEVKGGQVRRTNGMWEFEDRHGKVNYKHEGPFQQVGSAAPALFNHLKEKFAWFQDYITGSGVLFPDIEFTQTGPDINPDIIYDERHTGQDILRYIDRITSYWRKRQNKSAPAMNPSQLKLIRDALRGDFDLRPSLRAQIDRAVNELLQLTQEQYTVLDGLVENERVIVRGGAGTGKTLLAVEEARRQAAAGLKVMLCCFNKRLANYLRSSLVDQPNIHVAHLHGFMASIIHKADLRDRLPEVDEEDLFSVYYPELCIEGLIELQLFQTYDVLIIDEGQDLLRDTYIDVFDALLKNGLKNGQWRVFWDPFQDIYEGTTPSGMKVLDAARPSRFKLSVNCRNTEPIAVAVRILSGIDCQDTLKVVGPKVDHRFYRDEEHQRDLIKEEIDELLKSGIKADGIVILSARRFENSGLRPNLKDVPYRIVDADEAYSASKTPTIRFSTIASFKGLESDAVLLIDVDRLEGDELLSSIYVGGSRSKAYLTVFIAEKQRKHYESRSFEYGASIQPINKNI